MNMAVGLTVSNTGRGQVVRVCLGGSLHSPSACSF